MENVVKDVLVRSANTDSVFSFGVVPYLHACLCSSVYVHHWWVVFKLPRCFFDLFKVGWGIEKIFDVPVLHL